MAHIFTSVLPSSSKQNLRKTSRPKKEYNFAGGFDPDSDDKIEPNRVESSLFRLDPNSDNETDLEVTATSNAVGKATVTYRVFPVKKLRLELSCTCAGATGIFE